MAKDLATAASANVIRILVENHVSAQTCGQTASLLTAANPTQVKSARAMEAAIATSANVILLSLESSVKARRETKV